jgi:hypothetical protein
MFDGEHVLPGFSEEVEEVFDILTSLERESN